ncbi:NAD-dependent epimerase/dehydratase family protein [Williamsia sterculiae]|uniref:dTDP-L-rhamnose 4-epimerase n=1 Tax=Williamsia sterculiae TaxID=1344003 RepID=A0A1N7CFB7_9NOCA|nr:NAD-dependent epimerase/dehydratase family protein [Williamsia sterculiae]SIR62308.1 dTDP-L-rhamnose 4-epimerase [Williamsia sterculiae]
MRILLTGGAGFIGSRVRDQLTGRGHDVVVVDDMIPAAHGADAVAPDGVIRVNLRDADLDPLLDGVDAVCHQAAMVGAGVDANDAPEYAADNDFGSARLLAAMYRTGVRKLVFASSMVVYGDGSYVDAVGAPAFPAERSLDDLRSGRFDRYLPDGAVARWALTPEQTPAAPRSYYAASKLAQENYAKAWTLETGGSAIALRYHNVYGPHMPKDTPYAGVAAIFRSQLEAGAVPTVFEDGGQMRDFVHVDDVAAANVAALESDLTDFDAFNVCSGQPISILAVAQALTDTIGGADPVVTGDFRPGDVRHIVADPARARERLGFTAQVMPADGLHQFATAPLRG